MIRILFYLFTAVAIQVPCHAEVTKLSAENRNVLQNPSGFHEIHATTNLPPSIIALCADESGKIAEPIQKWQGTDLITDSKLPSKRLIWAANGGAYYIVHYERGGRGHSFHVLVATLRQDDPKPTAVWRGGADDRLDYAH
ncbi:MAG: hypothetical protein JWR19_1120 [Pedosphaera sp.]|nr:hypothetical protein [Pedosphaera sp.]